MTVHIMLDLETWGTEPGDDIRSIGACVFDPATGNVSECPICKGGTIQGNVNDGGDCSDCLNTRINHSETFHIACDNPQVGRGTVNHGIYQYYEPKYPLTRNPQTVQWWSNQSDEAKAAFVNPVDLAAALVQFGDWLRGLVDDHYYVISATEIYDDDIRLWCHGPSFDEPILRTAYRRLNLPVPWHYRASRDTRTILEAAGMDPHKGLEPFNTGTHHNALDDAICQARAVCEAYRRLRPGAQVQEYSQDVFGGLISAPRRVILQQFCEWLDERRALTTC